MGVITPLCPTEYLSLPVDRTTRLEETSFWARQIGPYEPGPPLRGSLNVDVAIVGAGFTGLNTAREFCNSHPGASVAVLESAVVGYGASGRNGGFSMKLFGLDPEITVLRWGRERMVAAHLALFERLLARQPVRIPVGPGPRAPDRFNAARSRGGRPVA